MGLIEPGWSVEKIKLMGADAVKLLAQFEPTEPLSAEHQFQLIEHVYAECKKHDILMLLETVAFPFGGEKKTDPSFMKPEGRNGHRLGPPAQPILRHLQGRVPRHAGPRIRQAAPRQPPGPDAASERPWVLLSAGVDYPDYYKQVQMAMEAGASGVLGGRAFWKEYFLQDGARPAASSPRPRRSNGSPTSIPWSASTVRPGPPVTALPKKTLTSIRATEGWHARYGSCLGSSDGAAPAKESPGEVY